MKIALELCTKLQQLIAAERAADIDALYQLLCQRCTSHLPMDELPLACDKRLLPCSRDGGPCPYFRTAGAAPELQEEARQPITLGHARKR